MNTEILATVNNVAIEAIENNSEIFIPIRSICTALGIDEEAQRQKVNRDRILSSTAFIIKAVGADGKDREMTCLPLKYIFGWLFTINVDRVRPEAQEAVLSYQKECYDALFSYFTDPIFFLKEKEKIVNEAADKRKIAKINFNTAKKEMQQADEMFDTVRRLSIEQWRANNRQLAIPFSQECESE